MSAGAEAHGRIVVVGSLNADLTIYCERLPLPGETVHGTGFAVNPGGKSANQAVAASLLGGAVSLVGAVGDDSNGEMLLSSTAGAGVDISHVRTSESAATGVAVIAVDAHGENNIIISAGANGTLAPADVAASADVFAGASVVCLCLEVSLDTVEAAARTGHDAGATVLLNLSPYGEIPPGLAELTDVLLVNAHEASLFLGSGEMPGAEAHDAAWDGVRERFAERGLQRVLVTLGASGSVVLDSLVSGTDRVTRIAPVTVHAVDTTGAGDAFTGAVAARLAAGEPLAEAAAFASVAAALAATRKGTQAAYAGVADVDRMRARLLS
ncbi:ribokinase [Arthrobacter sp. PvP102]|uniref:ribokinase n=1 Tax=unclassified Arthrobacter TaxID=235627 RepID=UPI001AE8999A|nr:MULTISPECIES: ribokinase [unclassified Arthrobacter]MBP1233635.1 ribokinase [Arthrobacter sp. PvP103]MBP1238770.1 ribokinase [Arthrobacter sp. PvP102]